MCQLHISLTRAAQIYLELHFYVELHTKKSPEFGRSRIWPDLGKWPDFGFAEAEIRCNPKN